MKSSLKPTRVFTGRVTCGSKIEQCSYYSFTLLFETEKYMNINRAAIEKILTASEVMTTSMMSKHWVKKQQLHVKWWQPPIKVTTLSKKCQVIFYKEQRWMSWVTTFNQGGQNSLSQNILKKTILFPQNAQHCQSDLFKVLNRYSTNYITSMIVSTQSQRMQTFNCKHGI